MQQLESLPCVVREAELVQVRIPTCVALTLAPKVIQLSRASLFWLASEFGMRLCLPGPDVACGELPKRGAQSAAGPGGGRGAAGAAAGHRHHSGRGPA